MNKNIIKIFLVWLILLLAVGLYSSHLPVYKGTKCNVKNQLPFYRWDSFWYTSISRHGYTFSEEKNSSIAFFPSYPLIIKTAHLLSKIKEDKVSFGLNILFSYFSLLFLYRLARMDYSRKTSLSIAAVFLFFPPAYFFLSGYPEALFVLLAILSLYFARKKEWTRAGIAVGILAITKPYGIFMLPVLLLEYLWNHDWDIKIFFKKVNWLPLLLPLATLGSFLLFNYLEFHNFTAFLTAQQTWGRSLSNPAKALLEESQHYLFSGNVLTGSNFPYLIYLGSFFFSILAFVLSWKRVRKTYLLFPALLLLSALLTGTLTSWGRYMLLGFPILFGPAIFLSKRKYLFIGYLIASASLLLFLASLFVRCYPVE
jgi:Gpi18-like mannosyltransferase